ncbi:hypothetical protein GUJ93_ZPchr0007g3440 [Zizania palustris]|uniref:Uncharacterized protein n=1 Tax=Zizania palustris TaxID=103762 RepID=A0A8J5VP02_ZIZPA|nr:hypothetical protein GUJ93_ZPchr0007g3440 [Zizania palustris]
MREQLEHEDDMGRARSTAPVVVRVHLGAVSNKRLRRALMQQRRGTRKERKRPVGGDVGESELLPPPPPSPLRIASAREGGEERSGRRR